MRTIASAIRSTQAALRTFHRHEQRGDAHPSADRRATLIILDAARPDVFCDLVEAGELPNLSHYILAEGGIVPATTVFPSTTGVAYLPLLTGCYPGTCNVPGIRWLDRARYGGRWWTDRQYVRSYCGYGAGMLSDDVSQDVIGLFELEADGLALCSPFTRGLRPADNRLRWQRRFWGSLSHYWTPGYAAMDRAVGAALVESAVQRRRLTFAVFPGVDGITHHRHPRHPSVLRLYRQFDEFFGKYAAAGGLEGDHLCIIVSDHGATPVERHEDLSVALERRGLRVLRHPLVWRRDPALAVMVSGNASAQIYLRPGWRRSERWTLEAIEAGQVPGIPDDLVRYLVGLEGVALVAGTEGESVVAVSRSGRARLSPQGAAIRYEPLTGDVLGLGNSAAIRNQREWLELSYDGPYPDAPAQLLQVFRSPRAGDLVVVAAPGCDLREDWEIPRHRSGHGGLTAEHMRCLVVVNRALAGPLRTVDIFPMILEHLEYPIPSGIDGVADRACSAQPAVVA